MSILSQPIAVQQQQAKIDADISKTFEKLEQIGNFKGKVSNKQWLQKIYDILASMRDAHRIIDEQKQMLLKSVVYEFKKANGKMIQPGEKVQEDEDLSEWNFVDNMSNDELISASQEIFENYDINTELFLQGL